MSANKEEFLRHTIDAYKSQGHRVENLSQGQGQGDLRVTDPLTGRSRLVEAKYVQSANPSVKKIEQDIRAKNAKMSDQLGRPGFKGATELAIHTHADPGTNATALSNFLRHPARTSDKSVLTGVDLISRRDGKTTVHQVDKKALASKRPAAVVGAGVAATKAVAKPASKPPPAKSAQAVKPSTVSRTPAPKPPPSGLDRPPSHAVAKPSGGAIRGAGPNSPTAAPRPPVKPPVKAAAPIVRPAPPATKLPSPNPPTHRPPPPRPPAGGGRPPMPGAR